MNEQSTEQRVPFEPERRPLSRQRMIPGLSAITFIGLATIAVFFFLVTQVTPRWVDNISLSISNLSATATAVPVPLLATATPLPLATDTPAPPTATPAGSSEYVKVANTDGQGVRLRARPQQSAPRVTSLPEGTILKVIGLDQTNTDATWRNVRTTDGSNDEGWINTTYLVASPAP